MARTAEQIEVDLINATTMEEAELLMEELEPHLERRAAGPEGKRILEKARKFMAARDSNGKQYNAA